MMICTAKTQFGLEGVLAEELKQRGYSGIVTLNRAVSFETDQKGLYKANLVLRTAQKITVPLFEFEAFTEKELYDGIYQYDWVSLISITKTFAIEPIVKSEFFNHSQYAAQKSKDAIVDKIRSQTGSRPNVDLQNPDFHLQINIFANKVYVMLNSSGEPLYKRGYRKHTVEAPLNEILASGMLLIAGYNGSKPFYDGMCGSGTLLTEAGLIAANVAPGLFRKDFGFMHWDDFDRKALQDLKEELESEKKVPEHRIFGSDVSNMAVAISQENAHSAGLDKIVEVVRKPFQKLKPEGDAGILMMNPPYGERLKDDEIIESYKLIGDHLKNQFEGFDAWLISSNMEALKFVGLKTSQRTTLYNGNLECRFNKYELYKGSKKDQYASYEKPLNV